MAIEARNMWLEWNKQVASTPQSQLPAGLSQDDELLLECGNYFIAEGSELRQFYAESLASMERTAPDFRKTQFVRVSLNISPEGFDMRETSPSDYGTG